MKDKVKLEKIHLQIQGTAQYKRKFKFKKLIQAVMIKLLKMWNLKNKILQIIVLKKYRIKNAVQLKQRSLQLNSAI